MSKFLRIALILSLVLFPAKNTHAMYGLKALLDMGKSWIQNRQQVDGDEGSEDRARENGAEKDQEKSDPVQAQAQEEGQKEPSPSQDQDVVEIEHPWFDSENIQQPAENPRPNKFTEIVLEKITFLGSGQNNRAVISSPIAEKREYAVGDEIHDGWSIKGIMPEKVILVKEGRARELMPTIFTYKLIGNDIEFIIDENLLNYSEFLKYLKNSQLQEAQNKIITLKDGPRDDATLLESWQICSVYHLLKACQELEQASRDDKKIMREKLIETIAQAGEAAPEIFSLIEMFQIDALKDLPAEIVVVKAARDENLLANLEPKNAQSLTQTIDALTDETSQRIMDYLIATHRPLAYKTLPTFAKIDQDVTANVDKQNLGAIICTIYAANKRHVSLANTKTRITFQWIVHDSPVIQAFFSPVGKKLITLEENGTVNIYEPQGQKWARTKKLKSLSREKCSIAISDCGNFLFTVVTVTVDKKDSQNINVLTLEGKPVRTLPTNSELTAMHYQSNPPVIIGRTSINTNLTFSFEIPKEDNKKLLKSFIYILMLQKIKRTNYEPQQLSQEFTRIHIDMPYHIKYVIPYFFGQEAYKVIDNL